MLERGISFSLAVNLAAILTVISSVVAAQETTTTLVVQLSGFADDQGKAILRIHDSTESVVKDSARIQMLSDIHEGKADIIVKDFKVGKWALVGHHDRNRNGKVDHGWNRFPMERMAFSHDFRPGIAAGFPTFEKLAVQLNAPSDTIRLVVKDVNAASFFTRSRK